MPSKAPNNRRAVIEAAAAELIAARGFDGVGIDDIGRRAGVTGPAVYRHFSGKEAVLEAILVDTADEVVSRLSDEPPVDTPEALVAEFLDIALDMAPRIATLLREQERAPKADKKRVQSAINRLYGRAERAVSLANPALDDLSRRVRVAALTGPLGSGMLGWRDDWMPRPALDDLLVNAAIRMFATSAPDNAAIAPPTGRWRPPMTRRAEIRREALALFRQRGFNAVSVDEIGQAVGVSGPTVYYYFKNKAAILEDGFFQVSQLLAANFDSAINGATSPANAIDRLVRAVATLSMDNVDLFVVYARVIGPLEMEEVAREELGLIDMLKVWAEILSQAQPELSPEEAMVLIRLAIPMIFEMAQTCEEHPGRVDEIVAVADALFDVSN